jgi:hypothetical protein
MIAFLAVVVGVVGILWWMSQPSTASGGDKSALEPASSAPPGKASSANNPPGLPGAPPSSNRELCSVDQVKKFIAHQLAAGEVPDEELTQAASHVLSMLTQAGLAERGCVSPADVTAALFDMAEQDEGNEP